MREGHRNTQGETGKFLLVMLIWLMPLTISAQKADQTITFDPVPQKRFGDPAFSFTATASSGLPVFFSSNNFNVITTTTMGTFVTIKGVGEAIITASQPGNSSFNAAPPVTQVVVVIKNLQSITFPLLPLKTYGNTDFNPGAVASSELAVTYSTSDPQTATIVDGKVHIVRAGEVDIIANQLGNVDYLPAITAIQTLTIQKATNHMGFVTTPVGSYGSPPIAVQGYSSTGGSVTQFHSEYETIASFTGNLLSFHRVGSTLLTVSHPGNENYLPGQGTFMLNVTKASQTITFDALPTQPMGTQPVTLTATSSSGLPVVYSSSRKTVGTVKGNTLYINSIGTGTITATQPGNGNYLPATNVSRTLTVTGAANSYPLTGTTATGGTGKGTVFAMNSDGSSFQTKHNFPPFANTLPNGGLLKASDGKLYGVITWAGSPAHGVVFSMNADGSGYQILHNFNMNDGSGPVGTLVEMPNGYLYGVTTYGGFNVGVIYRILKDGTGFSVLHNFSTSYYPLAGLMKGANGKLYGTTPQGGAIGYGTMFSINADGTGYTDLVSFDGSTKGANPRGPLIQGGTIIYGMTGNGGVNNKGVLFKVNASGTGFSKLVEFDGANNGSFGSAGLLLGSDGKLYGMTQKGGANDKGTIFSVATNGTGFTKLFDFDGPNSGSLPLSTLTESADGLLYGMTNEGGTDDLGVTFKINKDGTGFVRLLDFNGSNGAKPILGPLLEKDPNLFVAMTSKGGSSNAGMILSVTSTGTFTLIKDFPQAPSSPSLLISNYAADKLFGPATTGGVHGNGSIFSTNPDGSGLAHLIELEGNYLYIDELISTPESTLWGIGREEYFTDNQFIIKVNENGTGYQRVYRMGDFPQVGLDPEWLIDFDAEYIYGYTSTGGTFSAGSIFKAKKDGSGMVKVADIPGGVQGARPYTNIIRHSNGDIYGVTHEGGTNNYGAVFRVSIAGTYTKLYDLNSATTGGYIKKIVELRGGSLCIATATNAANHSGSLFTLDENGQGYEKILDFGASTGTDLADMSQTDDGYIVAAMRLGGAGGQGVVFRVLPDGSGFAKLHEFNGTDGSAPNALVFQKAAQSILSFNAIPQREFVDPPFLLEATTSSGAAVTFTSSNENVATISGYTVTIHGPGTTTITGVIPASTHFTQSLPAQQSFTVVQSTYQLVLDDIPEKKYGIPMFTPHYTITPELPVTLMSSNPAVAVVDAFNRVTITGVGNSTITATADGGANFVMMTPVSKILTVVQGPQQITFDPLPVKFQDTPPFLLTATASSGFPVSYVTSTPSVASLSGNEVTIGTSGQSTITASIGAQINYLAATPVSRILSVIKHDQQIVLDDIADKPLSVGSFALQPASTSGLPVVLTTTSAHVTLQDHTVTLVTPGSVTIHADEPGTAVMTAAARVSRAFCIIPPTPTITEDLTDPTAPILTSDAATGNNWFKNGVAMGIATQSITLDASATYTVRVDIEGCQSTLSIPHTIKVVVGLESPEGQILIYPNPVVDKLTIDLSSLPRATPAYLQILDILGREVGRVKADDETMVWELHTLSEGSYLLRICKGEVVKVVKFVKR